MLKFLKRLFAFALVILLAAVFWGVFAIWTGIYSVYSFPPSKDRPDGVTLIVSRDQGEPMFNSPDYKPAPPKLEPKSGGLRFGAAKKPAQPLKDRTLLTLPYVEWAYRKSLEPEPPAGE
jgi:hypothetical protein